MFQSKNLLFNAMQNAIYDRLHSAVYWALNYTVGYLTDPDDPDEEENLLREWRDLGAYTVACIVVLSKWEEGPALPHIDRLEPWLVKYLRPYNEAAVLPIVQQWLDREPLPEHVSRNPQDEDMKVRHLKNLVAAIHEAEKPTVRKMIP